MGGKRWPNKRQREKHKETHRERLRDSMRDTYTGKGVLLWRQKDGFASQLIYFKLCEVGKVT